MNERPNLEGQNRSANDDQAKARFFVISLARLVGAVMVMIGLLGINGAISLSTIPSYVLIAFGLFDVFFVPALLSKRWSSRKP